MTETSRHTMVAKVVARDGVRDARDGNDKRLHSSPEAEATDGIDTFGCGERGR
jgi:hypothetical protein